MTEESNPFLEINQNLIIGLAIAASILAIVLYYENKQLKDQMGMLSSAKREPCNCHETQTVVRETPSSVSVPITTTDAKPPEVVVD